MTRCYSGKTMRVIENDYVREAERHPELIKAFPEQAMLSSQRGVMGGIGGKIEGLDPARDCLAAGQGAGAIRQVLPAGEIVRAVVREAEQVLGALGQRALAPR